MRIIRIFVASSEELRQERLELAELVEHLNHTFSNQGIQLQLEKWEYLDSSMGPMHKQEEYNKVLEKCEICLVLYWTRFGMFTKTELDLAYKNLCEGKNPQKLYVYFKSTDRMSPELEAFKNSFIKDYGHFVCRFDNVDTLKADFLLQFMDYLNTQRADATVEFKDAKLFIKGQAYADLSNVPFASRNQDYTLLHQQIQELRIRLAGMDAEDADYEGTSSELQRLTDKLQSIETNLRDTALMVTRLRNTNCSERLQRAIELFTNGDSRAAGAILSDDEILKDAEHNISLINLGREAASSLVTNLDECKFKIKMLQNEMLDGWADQVKLLYQKCLEWGRGNVDDAYFAETLTEYVSFLNWQGLYEEVETLSLEAVGMYERLRMATPNGFSVELYNCYQNLIEFYLHSEDYEKAEKVILKALLIVDDNLTPARRPVLLTQLAEIHENRLEYDCAEKELKDAITILENLLTRVHDDVLADALLKLAKLYTNKDLLDDAKSFALRALEVFESVKDLDAAYVLGFKASVYELLGNIYVNGGQFEAAEAWYQKYKEITDVLAKQNPQTYKLHQAKGLANLSNVQAQLNLYEDAMVNSMEAVQLITKLYKLHPNQYADEYGEMLFDQASKLLEAENYDQAEKLLREVLDVYQVISQTHQRIVHIKKARVYNLLANVLQRQERYREARNLYIKALTIRKQLCKKYGYKNNVETVETLNDWSNMEMSIGFEEKAISGFKEALVINRRLRDEYGIDTNTDMATNCYNLGCGYMKLNGFDDAKKYYLQAVEFYQHTPSSMGNRYNRFYMGKSYGSIAQICAFLNDFKGWKKNQLEAVAIFKELAHENPDLYNKDFSDCCYTYSNMNYLLGFHVDAYEYAKWAVEAAKDVDLMEKAGQALHLLSCIQLQLGEYKEAQSGLLECIEIWEDECMDESIKAGKIAQEQQELSKLFTLLGLKRKAKQLREEAKVNYKKIANKDKKLFEGVFDDL